MLSRKVDKCKPLMLGRPVVVESASEGQLAVEAAALAERHGLNEDQAGAVAGALTAAAEAGRGLAAAALTVSPVRLVHGRALQSLKP